MLKGDEIVKLNWLAVEKVEKESLKYIDPAWANLEVKNVREAGR